MSETEELQNDEREALISIYEGDPCFKQVSNNCFQYKYGEEDSIKSFLLEITWTDNYPNELPTLNVETFYNRNLIQEVKKNIVATASKEAENWIGCGMTYTLFECLKENSNEILESQPENPVNELISNVDKVDLNQQKVAVNKKENLTKSQKRRQWEQSDHKGEKPRGYNWVDIVKHLSQTGGKNETT